MKTGTQIWIDKLIAKPVALILNIVTRILGKLFSIDHNLNKPFRKIAVCKFKGMGSIIQSTPLLQAVRSLYPDAEIIYVTTEANRKLMERIPIVDTVVCLDDRSIPRLLRSFAKGIYTLMGKRPDVYIDLEIYSNFSTIFTLLTLSRNRMGYYLRSSSYRLGIYTHMMFFNPRVPISQVYLQMARLLGYAGEKPSLYPLQREVTPNPRLQPEGNYILINPNASDLRIERRWAGSNFRKLIEMLLEKYPSETIVLIGSRGEMEYTSSVVDGLHSPRVLNLAGKTTLDELIALVSRARMLITNDTGPMHIAFACKTPTVCLFGPCSPEQYGDNPNASVIYYKVFCSPCVHDFEIPPCKGDNVCMQKITIADVLGEADAVYKQTGPSWQYTDQTIYFHQQKTLGLINR